MAPSDPLGASACTRVVAYSTDMVKRDELPHSVLDFATEEWKDKVAFVPTSGAFQQQIIAIKLLKERDAALDWLKGLKAYGQAYSGNMAALQAIVDPVAEYQLRSGVKSPFPLKPFNQLEANDITPGIGAALALLALELMRELTAPPFASMLVLVSAVPVYVFARRTLNAQEIA